MRYLNEKQYYIDLYDLFTIKDCLEVIDTFREIYQKSLKDKATKDIPKEEKLKASNQLLGWQLFTTKGERYRNKAQRLEEMIEEDRKKQDFFDNASEPSNITCYTCGKKLFSDTKILEDYGDTPMRVLFYYPCKACKKKRSVYNTGEEFIVRPQLCPKCKHELIEKHTIETKGKGKIITWMQSCPSCKFTDKQVDDFEKSHAEWEKKQQEDKTLLEKYRKKFCLTEEKGKEYIETIEKMKYAHEVFEEEKQKYDSPVYQRSTQLKKVSVVELEKLLIESLEKEKYIKLSFDKPEIEQYVIIPFTVQDADSSRQGHISTQALEKHLKKALEDSNWRLMSNSLSYRLGYVEGRLKGVEREEDMWELAGKKTEQKPKEQNPELRMKYGSDNYVQLARMFGKHEGIENVRKRRLEKEPNGFFLEVSEGPYNCGICHDLTPGNRTWWDLDGIRCADCQRNLEENVFPREICKNDKIWIKEWQLKSDYSLQPATRKKLLREGVLKGRELKRQDGNTYCTIYLVEENKDFFKKYPKKPAMKIEWKTVDDKGNEIKY